MLRFNGFGEEREVEKDGDEVWKLGGGRGDVSSTYCNLIAAAAGKIGRMAYVNVIYIVGLRGRCSDS